MPCLAQDEYLALLQNKQAGKRYLKDWHFAHAFPDEPVYTYGSSTLTLLTELHAAPCEKLCDH